MLVAAARVEIELPEPIDLRLTLAPIAHGRGDPTFRSGPDGIWWAVRVPSGAATIRIRGDTRRVVAEAWGDGADEALAGVGDLIGLADEVAAFVPHDPVVAELHRLHRDLRLPRTHRVWHALLAAICEQKVTGVEAREAFRGLVLAHGEPAPGPGGRWLVPTPGKLAGLAYFAFHPFGIERRRAEVISRAATAMPRIETAAPDRAGQLLRSIPGIGPWTMAEVARVAWGDPDAVSVGDYHLPSLVAWALTGERHADDARMLELLEPYAGQRGRVQRLLEISGRQPPRRGPRMAPRQIRDR
jgi:3-methyladenine DNA glycosylase/8-oxoguanine DNA glycosylase